METSLRPWRTTCIALVGAGAIAMAPINPTNPITASPAPVPTAISAPALHTTAFEIPYILTLPVLRQSIRNDFYYWGVLLNGFAEAGAGALQTLGSIPETIATFTQQVLALDFVGAFDTLGSAITDGVVAIGQPLLDSLIERRQTTLAIQTALQAAGPEAFFAVVNSVLSAGNTVVTSAIVGTQNLVQAISTLDLSNIVDAAVDGTKGFVTALGQGAGDIVTGVESAQKTLVTALATRAPTGSAATAKSANAVPDLGAKTVTLSVTAPRSAAPGSPSGAGVAQATKRAAHHNAGHAKASGKAAPARSAAAK
jgi:hypothetical protein